MISKLTRKTLSKLLAISASNCRKSTCQERFGRNGNNLLSSQKISNNNSRLVRRLVLKVVVYKTFTVLF